MLTSTIVEPTSIEEAAQRYAALADATRLRVLVTIAGGEKCVCDVQAAVDVAPNLLSYHLRILREAGLVTATRRARWIFYAVDPAHASFVDDALRHAGVPRDTYGPATAPKRRSS